MTEFEGRVALVVGASGAIGASICRMLAQRGARVEMTYGRSREAIGALSEEIGGGIHQLDVRDREQVQQTVDAVLKKHGRIDSIVNTAGYMHGLSLFEAMPADEVRDTIEIELFGVMNLARAVVPPMRTAGYGRFVTVGSDSGKVGAKGVAASAAARGGMIAFTKSLAREVASSDICVNAVCPGPTDSRLFDALTAEDDITGKQMRAMVRAIPKKRAARPEEVAAVAVFLASPAASFVTGQAISASGGLTMS